MELYRDEDRAAGGNKCVFSNSTCTSPHLFQHHDCFSLFVRSSWYHSPRLLLVNFIVVKPHLTEPTCFAHLCLSHLWPFQMSVCFSVNHATVVTIISVASSKVEASVYSSSVGTLYLVYTFSALLISTSMVRAFLFWDVSNQIDFFFAGG